MNRRTSLLSVAIVCGAIHAGVFGQTSDAVYSAITDRVARAKPALPAIGAAGSSWTDPIFASRMWRITDGLTRPGLLDRSYRTPSSAHQNAWSADGRSFYVVSTDGTVIPFSFDPLTAAASRLNPMSTGEGGFVLRFYIEPHFSMCRTD